VTNSNREILRQNSTELLMLQALMENGSPRERAVSIIETMSTIEMEKYLGLIKESP